MLVETQISYLVTSLSRKNYKASVGELQKLVTLYGQDAHIHLIRCLFRHVNISDSKGNKDQMYQTTLLKEELASLLKTEYYTGALLSVVESPEHQNKGKFPSFFLPQLARLVKLSPVQDLQIGLALTKSTNSEIQGYAKTFTKAKLVDVLSRSDTSIPEKIIHKVLLCIGPGEAVALGASWDQCEAYLSAQRKAALPGSANLLGPLLNPASADDSIVHMRTVAADSGTRDLFEGIQSHIALSQLMVECGYSCSATIETMSALLAEFGKDDLSADAVAKAVGMMVQSHSGLGESMLLLTSLADGASWEKKAEGALARKDVSTWDVHNFVDAVATMLPDLDWLAVYDKLDHDGFEVKDFLGLSLLIKIFRRASKAPFPSQAFFKPWKNVAGQFSVLSLLVAQDHIKSPDVATFFSSLPQNAQVSREGLKPANLESVPEAWAHIPFVDALLSTGQSQFYTQVQQLFFEHAKNPACNDLMVMATACCKGGSVTPLQQEVLERLLHPFFGQHPNATVVMQHVWDHQPAVVLKAMPAFYAASPDMERIGRILDIAQDTKAFTQVLQSAEFVFVVELAVLASHRQFLNLEKWLEGHLKSPKHAFVMACIAYARKRLASNVSSASIPQKESAAAILRALSAVSKSLSSEAASEVRVLIESHMPKASPPSEDGSNTSAGGSEGGESLLAPDLLGQRAGMTQGQGGQGQFQGSSGGGGGGGDAAAMQAGWQQGGPQSPQQQQQQQQFQQQQFNQQQQQQQQMQQQKQQQQQSQQQQMAMQQQQQQQQQYQQMMMQQQQRQGMQQGGHMQGGHMQGANQAAMGSGGQGQPTAGQTTDGMGVVQAVQGAAGDVTNRTYSTQIDDEANSYFQQIYTEQKSIEQVVALLQQFKNSQQQREQDIFGCMIRNLFDEYRFFPQYPDKELHITGILFGSLVQHELVTYQSLSKALRFVLDALKKDPSTKMHRFGLCGLERFKDRLYEWPQYCEMVRDIPHFRTLPAPLQEACQRGAASATSGEKGGADAGNFAPQGSPAGGNGTGGSTPRQAERIPAMSGMQTQSAVLGDTDGAEEYVKPTGVEQDKIHFIFNNISAGNLEDKARELRALIDPQYLGWTAQYLVVKRCSIEPNFHQLYLKFIAAINIPEYFRLVLKETFSNVRLLLKSKQIATTQASSERTLLKNLGGWLGLQTIAKNRPILHRDLGFKELLLYAYEGRTQRLMYVMPFVARVLEACQHSRVFRPPNPWTMAMLAVLKELHQLPKLKLNLKFEVEVLCKNLGIDINMIEPSNLLKDVVQLEGGESAGSLHAGVKIVVGGLPTSQPAAPPPPPPGPTFPELKPGTVSSIRRYVSIGDGSGSAKITLFQEQPRLAQAVPGALERAIEEIINPVVDRSIKIACISCHKLVSKDFVLEPNETKMQKAAHMMVQHLAGSLAMVTAKEPARVSIGNHLRTLLMNEMSTPEQKPTPPQIQMIDQAVQVAVNDNLDLVCSYIEKSAMERAVKEVDEVLAEEYSDRRAYNASPQASERPYMSKLSGAAATLQNLPVYLRPQVSGLTPKQLSLYENFNVATDAAAAAAFNAAPEGPAAPAAPSPKAVPKSPAQGGGQPGGPPSGGGAGEQGNAPPAAALDKVVSELNAAISTCGNVRDLQSLPPTHEIHNFIREIQSVVQQSRGEAVPPLTRKFVAALFNNDAPSIKRDIYFNLLAHFNDAYRGAAGQEATKTYIISQDERKYDAVVVSRLLASRLLIPSELDNYFVKASDMGKNFRVVGFAEEVLRHCFLGQVARHLNVTDFGQTIDMIAHLARKSQPQPRTVELLEVLIKQRQASARAGGQAGGPPGGRAPVSAVMEEPGDPQGLKESVGMHFEEWLRLVRQPTATKGEKADVMFISRLLQQGMLRTDDISTRFFRLSTDFAVHVFMSTAAAQGPDAANDVTSGAYNGIDAFSKLIVVLLKHFGESTKVALLNKVLTTIITVLTRDHKRLQHQFNQKPFFRLLCNLLFEVHTAEDSVTFQVLNAFSHAFHLLRPAVVPAFAFGWLELVSHRQFMPKLLLMKDPKGWQMLQRLLVDLFSYMAPFLRGGEMHPAVRTLYKGTLRMLLVLLHDFPEFLADHHFSLCDVIPVTCVQMRNLILSAFPRNMRLPDPFTPNLNVDHLPESSQPPRVLSNVAGALEVSNLRADLDNYMRQRGPPQFVKRLLSRMVVPSPAGSEGAQTPDGAPRLNISVLNALVLYVGNKAIEDTKMVSQESFLASSPAMDIFQHLAFELDSEGRYMLFNAIANQLRYPNSHTHYFRCVMLTLFQGATKEYIKEQITRVMLERLIVNRPHPWGLLITFIDLMNNPRYQFWSHKFVTCAPEIHRLFESVARSCHSATTRVTGDGGQQAGPPAASA